MATPKLWENASPQETQIWEFIQLVNLRYKQSFRNYYELYDWSIEHIPELWGEVWSYCGIRQSQEYEKVVSDDNTMFPRPKWFEGARLNFAENLLFPTQAVADEDIAIIAVTEISEEKITWAELRERVRSCQTGMIAAGVKAGDCIAGYVANTANALVAMLATTSLGAIWTAISPDTGVTAVLDKLSQISPVVLFADEEVFYGGKAHPVLPKLNEIAQGLPPLRRVVVFGGTGDREAKCQQDLFVKYDTFTASGEASETSLRFEQLPPDHPVYILYSSGTTGLPKCIVHGAIGTLLQHKKEHILHCDIHPGDRLFYYTTCTWMMWHWLVSGLASGATLILYDGSPFHSSESGKSIKDELTMPRLIEKFQITHFGTSAKYLSVLEQGSAMPKESGLLLASLKAIYSTGSPLAPSTFQYVYRAFGDVNLGSITGGTDIISLFGAPCSIYPVYVGEVQVLGLGMAVKAWDFEGNDVSQSGEAGDLVCIRPFPSQPVAFWGTGGEKKYRSSYFDHFEGVWHHGDFIRFNPETRGMIMLGRSDGILKPSGVRFGSAEIYNILLKHFPDEVEDALCIGRRREQDTDEAVVLFLKMKDTRSISDELVGNIKKTIRQELSARHVPAFVDECPAIPITANGKKVEGTVKQILCGSNIRTSASIANAECLEWYRDWALKH